MMTYVMPKCSKEIAASDAFQLFPLNSRRPTNMVVDCM